MATPANLTGATSTVKVDGTDLHDYGMVVSNVNNPIPRARKSVTQIFGRHGDFDFSKIYSPRTMTISGYILGDTNTQLLSNIDSLKEFFRLRDNNNTFQVIFQNQLTRYWSCKFEGQFTTKALSGWFYGKAVSFSLTLKCTKPYAEKTTMTTVVLNNALTRSLNINKILLFDYAGNVPTPLKIQLKPLSTENLAEKWEGAINEDNTLWGTDNCTGSDVAVGTNFGTFGTNYVRFTQDAGGVYYARITINDHVDTDKRYLISAYSVEPVKSYHNCSLKIWTDGAGGDQTAQFLDSSPLGFSIQRQWIELTPAIMLGMSYIHVGIENDGDDSPMGIDGFMIQEISADFDENLDIPDPYISDTGGDDIVDLKNPVLTLINELNLCQYSKGDIETDWTTTDADTNIDTIPDIEDSEKRCFILMFQGEAPHTSHIIYSPKIYIPGVYTSGYASIIISLKYKRVSGTGTLTLIPYVYMDDGNERAFNASVSIGSAEIWTSFVSKTASANWGYQIGKGSSYLKLGFKVSAGSVFLVKEIIAEIDQGSANSYEDYKAKLISLQTGVLQSTDIINIDSENLIMEMFDNSGKNIINLMQYFTGDRLLATPGNNILRLSDDREDSATPESISSGACKIEVRYRERYL